MKLHQFGPHQEDMQTLVPKQRICLMLTLILQLANRIGCGDLPPPSTNQLNGGELSQAPTELTILDTLQALIAHMQSQDAKHQLQQQQQQQKQQQAQAEQLQALKQSSDGNQSSQTQRPSGDLYELHSVSRLLLERFNFLFGHDELRRFVEQQQQQLAIDWLSLQANLNLNLSSSQFQQQQSTLETRTLSLIQSNLSKLSSINVDELSQQQQKRNFIRVLNRVFSRIELPEPFQKAGSMSRSSSQSTGSSTLNPGGPVGSGVVGGVGASLSNGLHCASHIGCIAEIPNVPVMFKLKSNVSAAFTIYTSERGGFKGGQRILYEPLIHYQLRDGSEQTMSELALQKEVLNITHSLKLAITNQHHNYHHHHQKHRQHQTGGGGGAVVAAGKKQASKLLATVATSWISANKIVASRELPFDLAALERSGFNASLNTRIIIGGYFAKEDEEWIDELVRQWLQLEDCNVIKVSWQDSNRGLYHSAAHNSRIVGRQLSLFLHYLNELFEVDLNKFHLVGHSLGAHIAGFVGADNDGQIARITGLDPAGPIFVDLNQSHRLDASDAKFVDILHTNGGPITKGALGLSLPSGHVDYYCNGGSLQPGCFFSSVTMSTIMDPVERIACNHRRSYRYFTEIIRLAISERRNLAPRAADLSADERTTTSSNLSNKFPSAFLFETNKFEDLVRLVQPELKMSSLSSTRRLAQEEGGKLTPSFSIPAMPLKRQIEFHLMDPEFPRDQRGLYFFKTRPETPFFASRQYALRLGLEQPLKRKLTLLVKINSTLVAEVELDELERSQSLVFVPTNPETIDQSGALFRGSSSRAPPELWLMWRQRSFNLLLAHHAANEIHLKALELSLLDESDPVSSLEGDRSVAQNRQQQAAQSEYLIRYEPNLQSQERQLQVVQSSGGGDSSAQPQQQQPSPSQQPQATTATSQSLVLVRNQWHKFEGRPVAVE